MSGPQHARNVLLAALWVAAAVGLWQLLGTEESGRTDLEGDGEPGAAREDKGQGPLLIGRRPAPPDAEPATGTSRSDPTLPRPTPVGRPVADAPPRAPPPGVLPLAPGAVLDRVLSNARAPLILPRSYVLGRVGPYGVREQPGAAAVLDWSGVAQVERETRTASEAEEDTAAPITTAVRGVVVAADGAPIAGAEVILYSSFYLRQAYYDHRVRQIGRVLSDADGGFDLRPIDLDTVHFGADGDVLVTVRHAHYPDLVAQVLPGIRPGEESDVGKLVLPTRSARVFGVIRDLAGQPVAGAIVRASGAMNPVDYDKTERMIVLDACPKAISDAQGHYDLRDFVAGVHEISIHVNIDCVVHMRGTWSGEREWSPRVRAGNAIRGRVIDSDGEPVAAAVVAGGGNWTPTNPDGTFWLDNVQPGPLTLEVAHHQWQTVFVAGVETNAGGIDLELKQRLPRMTLEIVDEGEAPVALVAIDWAWLSGRRRGRFAPDSRFWHDPRGVFELTVPEGATGALVSKPDGSLKFTLTPEHLVGGAHVRIALAP